MGLYHRCTLDSAFKVSYPAIMNVTETTVLTRLPSGTPGRYWHQLGDGRIQCDLCPRFCKLREGQRGLCFVRARHNDAIILTTYGRSSGFCIDPIEKKPLNHFLPGTPVLSFGTAGCNLTCKFCQKTGTFPKLPNSIASRRRLRPMQLRELRKKWARVRSPSLTMTP